MRALSIALGLTFLFLAPEAFADESTVTLNGDIYKASIAGQWSSRI